ncbi:DUF992 domain-containing protein [Rhodoplanes serenus]|uniref:DUF992 domain-containing protein n=1 Tax=Rhodoplanes serenus TaxID=200615 RepID=A0A9X5ATA7_9BRAD|nr:DUF992 domain-containing protein [Rhodoplanes serenus]MTW18392.1 DUF992 domain-containing protein [Rhodoplanes serenus]
MIRLKSTLVAVAVVAAAPLPAAAQSSVQVGTLACNLAPSIGLIVGSRQRMTCTFSKADGFRETYRGTVTRIGLDLGFTAGGRMVWGVLAKTQGVRKRALAGTYVGASGDIGFGFGVGANALIGGNNRSIALQPLSVSGQVGVNLALGVAGLRLQ